MSNKDFFENQSALTAAKTKIYKEYIEGYLPKLLMTWGKCLIADLFCGPGKNGKENGSPLILLERLDYILSSDQLKKKSDKKVYVLFNEQDDSLVKNLNENLNKINYDKSIIDIRVKNEKYEKLLPDLIRIPEKQKIPKFFFLDPFTYSNVKLSHLKELMNLSNPEVLLFIPIFHSYRFSNVQIYNETHLTRVFIEEFTSKGMYNYENVYDFMDSIKEKLSKELNVPYVRYVLIDGGGSKNALFLLTKHQKGMLLMNKIAFKKTNDGKSIKIKTESVGNLFEIKETSVIFEQFKEELKEYIKKENTTNCDIVDFTIKKGLLPKHAKENLVNLHKANCIKVFDENQIEIHNNLKWNIADELSKTTYFKWQGDEKN